MMCSLAQAGEQEGGRSKCNAGRGDGCETGTGSDKEELDYQCHFRYA